MEGQLQAPGLKAPPPKNYVVAETSNQPQNSQQMQQQPQKPIIQQQAPAASAAAGGSSLQMQRQPAPVQGNAQSPNPNMYAQLESMMTAVRAEAKALEAVKQKIREMDGLRSQVGDLKGKLEEAETANKELVRSLQESKGVSDQLRLDMQQLNDFYSKEHAAYANAQQMVLKLEHDLQNVANEMGFYQKEAQRIPELRKKNQALVSQIGTLQKQAEEEKQINAQTTAALENKLAQAALDQAAQTEQFWHLAEEIKQLKQIVKDKEAALGAEDLNYKKAENDAKLTAIREGMRAEDSMSFLERERVNTNKLTAELSASQAEADSLRDILNHKEDQSIALNAKLRNIEEARQTEKSEVKAKIAALTETISVLKTKNHELEREGSEAQHRLGLMGGDLSRYTLEVEHLQAELSRGDIAKQQREAEFQRQLDAHIKEREDALEKLQKATQNFEAMQQQARDGQSRYWEELQRVKEAEAQLTDEADKLAQELEEKSTKLIMVEAERAKLEEYMRGEVSGAMQMTNALRSELERRLDELTSARKERDTALEEQHKNDEKVAELKKMMERQETNFKKALETDRNKISGEIKAKMQKLRGLEIEKQELLMEASNLMKQVESTQKDLTQARTEAEESRAAVKEAQKNIAELKDQNAALQKSSASAIQTQEELREHANRLEVSFKEDIGRLDTLVKESKKAAAQQVLEISDRVRQAQEQAEIAKAQAQFAAENEKKALEQAETVRTQMGISAKSHEEMQQQMARDMTAMRRELTEYRNKQKIGAESRTKMEMETMNARMEATKAENEVIKMTEYVKDVEGKMSQMQMEMQQVKQDRSELNREHNKLKMRAVELEEQITKKTTANEMLTKDMSKLEREGLVETRRLRLALQVAEQELGELKTTVPLLQKEMMESKNAFAKMQSSTNETVNGLLAELKNTEDALSSERRRTQQEADNYRRQIHEVSAALEKANAHIQENMARSTVANSDKEIRVLQLEQELERIKQAVILKEARMVELEKQHQADRTRIHEIKESLDNAERSIMDGKTNLELEQAQRKRLETRLKVLTASEHDRERSLSMSPRASLSTPRVDTSQLTPSSVEMRTKMLYGDVEDLAEPEFDDVRSAYQLDTESALTAIGASSSDIQGQSKSSPLAKKKLQKILSSGIAGDDEDFMAEAANNPRLGATSKSYDHLEVSKSYTGSVSEPVAGNPVVDRVSQALAARAAAESSKAALRQQAQLKSHERTSLRETDHDGSDRPPSGPTGKSKVREVRDMVTSASAGALELDSSPDKSSTDIEDSIQRTQMFLRQRLAARANGTKIETESARTSSMQGLPSDEERAQIAAREAQRIAELAYEKHGRPDYHRNTENAENQKVGKSEDDLHFNIKAPHLSPAKPINSINGGYGAKSMAGAAAAAGRIVYEDDDGHLEEPTRLPHISKSKRKGG